MYLVFITTLKSWISATVLPDRILNLACPPGTAPCCGLGAAKPAEDGIFPPLHFSYLFTTAVFTEPLQSTTTPLGLYWFNWVGAFAAKQSSHWLKLRNAGEHPAFFCFMVHIPPYSQLCSVKGQPWLHGQKAAAGGMGSICASFMITEAAPYVKLSNETALADRK